MRWELSYLHIVVESGDSLALRILFETRYKTEQDVRFIFVHTESFDLMPDIRREAEETSFVARMIFRRYKWNVIKDATLPALEWMLGQKTYTNLSEAETIGKVCEYEESYAARQEKIDDIEHEWRQMLPDVDFNKPSLWMPRAAQLMCRALEINQWERMEDEVDELNKRFQTFLKEKYQNIVSSSVPPKERSPRIVTHVLPFIAKQDAERTALVVIDGMNYWQAMLLVDEIGRRLDVAPRCDCLYSWLPSVTELSRQAIFRGSTPDENYPQSPHYEERLWREFWRMKHLADYAQNYQYDGQLEVRDNVMRQAYVTTGLDKLMHSSLNYKYLYRSTQLWVEEDEIIGNLRHLLERGFKIFITTDHGNIETEPLRQLSSSEKVGARRSMRHITLSPEANAEIFLEQWRDEVLQINGYDRTFYPTGRKAFSGVPTTVTHGGTHWLEVLVPFITIEN